MTDYQFTPDVVSEEMTVKQFVENYSEILTQDVMTYRELAAYFTDENLVNIVDGYYPLPSAFLVDCIEYVLDNYPNMIEL